MGQRTTSDRPDEAKGYQVKILYVVPSDIDPQLFDTNGVIARSVAAFQSWFQLVSGGLLLRLDTYQGALDVSFVRLPLTNQQFIVQAAATGQSIQPILDQLKVAGYNQPNKLYAIYLQGALRGEGVCGYGGEGYALIAINECGPRPGISSQGANYADLAMLHEVVHAMGFPAACATNFDAGHVTDDPTDLMSPGGQLPSSMDVRNDDYFKHSNLGCLDLAGSLFLEPPPSRHPGILGWPHVAWGWTVAAGPNNVHAVDPIGNRVLQFDASGQLVQWWGSQGSGPGEFETPLGLAVDGSGNVYVADQINNRVQVFNSSGKFVRMWGAQGVGSGQFNFPTGVAVSAMGHIVVLDHGNNRVQVFDSAGGFVGKWGLAGDSDGQFNGPVGIATDMAGRIFVADTGNHRVQMFSSSGEFIREWGSLGEKDGQFDEPLGIAVDDMGAVYVADTGNARIQVFDSNGQFQRKWGTSGRGLGQFLGPTGISVVGSERVYVADGQTRTLSVFDNSGLLQ